MTVHRAPLPGRRWRRHWRLYRRSCSSLRCLERSFVHHAPLQTSTQDFRAATLQLSLLRTKIAIFSAATPRRRNICLRHRSIQ